MEVLQVLLLHAAKNDDIIQVYHTVREIQLTQHILHKVLKGCWGVAQPERHAGELIESEATHRKGRVLLQLRSHLCTSKA